MPETRDSSSKGRANDMARPARVRFGAYVLDPRAKKLFHGTTPIPLPSRAVDALAYLIAHRDRAVDKDEIIGAVWRDVAVTDDSLIHAVSVIRRALGDDPAHAAFIETIPRRGYRFVGAIEAVDTPVEADLAARSNTADAPVPAIVPSTAVGRPGRPAIAAIAISIALAAVAFSLGWLATNRNRGDDTVRLQQMAPPGTVIVSGGVVSPAGRHLAFIARDRESGGTALWVRALDAPEPRRLASTDGASKPFFSPDGRTIAFFMKGTLVATDLDGDRLRSITAVHGAPAGGSWGADDVIVFADWTTGLYSVPASGGPVTPLTRLDPTALDAAHAWPQFLPDGRRFLYQVISADSSRSGIYVASIDAPRSIRLLDRAAAAAYVAPGFLVYLRNDMLMAQPFDAERLTFGGRAVVLARGVSAPSLADGNGISGSRQLLAFQEGDVAQQLTWVDRAGTPQGVLDVPTSMFNFRVSPDGRYVLAASSLTDSTGLWMVDLGRRHSTRLETDGIAPLWSPDAKFLAFTSRAGLDLNVRPSAEGQLRSLVSDRSVKVVNDWSPDARHIVYTRHDPETKLDLWHVPLTGEASRPLLQTMFNEAQARISPDGRWIAYASDESGTQEVYVRRYPTFDDPQLISKKGGGQPQWRGDQRELFYLSLDQSLMAVTVTSAGRLSFGPPQRLFRTAIGHGPSAARDSYAVMADGQSFLIEARRLNDGQPPIVVMRNWAAGLTATPPPAPLPRRPEPAAAALR
jgi:DNA-binding winged helix-turn-helix (wHTH) protein/Tol biopolymer transport system component